MDWIERDRSEREVWIEERGMDLKERDTSGKEVWIGERGIDLRDLREMERQFGEREREWERGV